MSNRIGRQVAPQKLADFYNMAGIAGEKPRRGGMGPESDESDHHDPPLEKGKRSLVDIFERVGSGGVHVHQQDAVALEQIRSDESRSHTRSGLREPPSGSRT